MATPNDQTGSDQPDGGLALDDRSGVLVATFQVTGLRLGIDAAHVREALQAQPLTIVPHSRPEVSGLLNLRGEVVTALDLRARLGLYADAEDRPTPMNLVVTIGSEPVSLLVDQIDDVIELDPEVIEPVPDTVEPHLRSLLEGVHQQPDGLLLILDLAEVITPTR